MKDIPMFTTETGVSTIILKEIPYKQIAYIKVRDVQPGGLAEHIAECIQFCRAAGAESVFASGHPGLEEHPLFCSILTMSLSMTELTEPEASLFPVTEGTVARWREVYNEKMRPVDNAATMTAYDEKEIVSSGGAYFVHEDGRLLGIGWMKGSEVLALAAAEPGAGERVLRTLLTVADSDRVTLEVASTNERAIRLYQRMGFLTIGERTRWYRVR